MKKISILSATILPLLILFYNGIAQQPSPNWVATYNGPANKADMVRAMVIDGQNNVYVTGPSDGEKRGNIDYATIKYNSVGQQQWVARYNGTGNGEDWPYAIAVGTDGNVYVTGRSIGTSGKYDYATVKYNSIGAQQWVARFNGSANLNDFGKDVKVDASGNVYVTGFANGNDGNVLRGNACVTIKYNSAGAEQWNKTYHVNSTGEVGNSLALGAFGNIYMAGESNGTVVIKYDSTGQELWAKNGGPGSDQKVLIDVSGNIVVSGGATTSKYNSDGTLLGEENFPGAWIYDMALDASGNIFVAGFISVAGEASNYITVKYNASGGQAWSASFSGTANSTDFVRSIALDNSDNIYVTGICTMGSGRSATTNYGTIKYNAAGDQKWLALYAGQAFGIVTDISGNIYVSGQTPGAGKTAGDDFGTLRYLASSTSARSVTTAPTAETKLPNFNLQNYPNPFYLNTTIEYQIPREEKVKLSVYDLSGKEIATLVNETKPAGVYKINFSTNKLSAGTYLCRMQVGDVIQTKKLALLK